MIARAAVGVSVVLDADFPAALTRLRRLARGGTLLRASEVAYAEGITSLMAFAGPAAGLTRLAEAGLEDLTQSDDCAHAALRWNAIAPDGKLFTALLADLMLRRAGEQTTVFSLIGTYWPPGPACAGLDQGAVRCCATAAIGRFLDCVACVLNHPAGTGGPAGHDLVP